MDTAAVNDGQWHHFAFARNGTNLLAYEDGAAIGSPTATTITDISSPSDFQLGGRATDSFLDGSLDEVSFYSRALTATEVTAIFNAGKDGKCP